MRSNRLSLRPRNAAYIRAALATVVILGASQLLAQDFDAAKLEETFNWDLYEQYKAHEVTTLDELAQDFEYQQAHWMPIAPPSTEFFGWTQDANLTVTPFDGAGLPKEFVAGLVPAYRGGVVVYPLTVWEDSKSRARVFYNADGKEIGSVAARQGYNPHWCLFGMYPDLERRAWSVDYVNQLALIYEPSHLLIRYNLILDDDLIKWVLSKSIRTSLRVQAADGKGMMKMDWQGGTATNVQFVDIKKETNGCVTVTLAYPDQYMTTANAAFEIFTCDGAQGLLDSTWSFGVVTNVNPSTNWIAWTNPDSSNSNVDIRFYSAALSNDCDSDGVSDGFEKFIYHTNPTNVDTDLDGMPDGWELAHEFSPGNAADAGEDTDADGLSNLQEFLFGTNPRTADTDQDGLLDGEEVAAGLSPLVNPLTHRLTSLVFSYDGQDRLAAVTSAVFSVSMTYDDAGNIGTLTCWGGE